MRGDDLLDLLLLIWAEIERTLDAIGDALGGFFGVHEGVAYAMDYGDCA